MKPTNSLPQSEEEEEEGESCTKMEYEIPEATRHDFELSGGRNLSYYTFVTPEQQQTNAKPVLYFHGFVGCGLEGAVCASKVAAAGGKLFAPDRPGFGHSEGYDSSLTSADERVQAFVNDLWEFISAMKWESLSIIAVSGGGPFALAFLTSYLDKQQSKQQDDDPSTVIPKLDAVSMVAAVCCSGGSEGMMETNKSLMNLVANQDKMSSRLGLNIMFGASYYLLKLLPSSWLLKLTPTTGVPPPDQEAMSNPQLTSHMMKVACLALRQGHSAAVNEACIIFRSKQGCEDSLRQYCKQQTSQVIPNIAIYQGDLDVNVPKSHATFMQEDLLQKRAVFVADTPDEYSQFALGVDSTAN